MKHSIIETTELFAWLVLGVVAGFLMLPGALHTEFDPQFQAMPGPQAAVVIFGSILAGAAIFFLVSAIWKYVPMWLKVALGIGGVSGIIYVWSSVAAQGLLWLMGVMRKPHVMLVIGVAMLFVSVWMFNVARKARWFATRASNMIMLCAIAAVGAIFAAKLSPVVAVLLLGAIAIYDAVAVWLLKSMQRMALDMMDSGIMPGIVVPKKKPIRVEGRDIDVALLGFGDVLFMVAVGGSLYLGGWWLLPTLGMFAAVAYLFLFAKPKKFYPAVPYLFAGCMLGIAVEFVLKVVA